MLRENALTRRDTRSTLSVACPPHPTPTRIASTNVSGAPVPLVLFLALVGISFAGPLVRLSHAHPLTIAIWRLGFALVFILGALVATGSWRQFRRLDRRGAGPRGRGGRHARASFLELERVGRHDDGRGVRRPRQRATGARRAALRRGARRAADQRAVARDRHRHVRGHRRGTARSGRVRGRDDGPRAHRRSSRPRRRGDRGVLRDRGAAPSLGARHLAVRVDRLRRLLRRCCSCSRAP